MRLRSAHKSDKKSEVELHVTKNQFYMQFDVQSKSCGVCKWIEMEREMLTVTKNEQFLL